LAAVVTAAVLAVACSVLQASGSEAAARMLATAAASGGVWGKALEVPGMAGLDNADGAEITSVSCASAGDCTAGGYSPDASGNNTQAYVVGETNNSWGTAQVVPGIAALNTGGIAQITSVSCASAGDCSAGGYYTDGSASTQAFVATQTGGRWGTAEEVPGTAALNAGAGPYSGAETTSVSCSSVGNCSAGGYYTDGSGDTQAFVATQTGGSWGTAEEVPGTAALNAGASSLSGAKTTAVSCAPAGNCSVGGYYTDGSGSVQAFVATQTGSTWGTAQELPGTAALNAFGGASVTAVSCASTGSCSAAGYYTDSSDNTQAFVATQTGSTWGTAQELPGTAALNISGNAVVTSVSCASTGNCSAGGYYNEQSVNGASYGAQAFVANETGGTWGTAQQVAGTGGQNTGNNTFVSSMSCASPGNCSAGGQYTDAGGNSQAFVVDETGGSWATAQEVPGTAALNAFGDAEVTSVSCASAGNCSAGGYYLDGNIAFQAFVASETSKHTSATALNLSAATVTYGNEQAEKVTATVSSAVTPTGTVTVTAGSITLCTITLAAGTGSCTLQATALPAGTYQVTASYSGDASTAPSVSLAQALTVSRTASATALKLSAATVAYGNEQTEKVSATVSGPGTPTGTVTVKAGTTTLCTITLASGSGSCSPAATILPAGSYQVIGTYSGNANLNPSASSAQGLTVISPHVTNLDAWAGYSAYPAAGYVSKQTASWTVPTISCPISINEKPSAAVWVGMWGSNSSMASKTGWLPQIGTESDCSEGFAIPPKLVWQMQSQVSGGGNTAQHGLDCPGDSTYYLCGNLTTISAGDKISASVTFLGPYRIVASVLTFQIQLTDLTTGKYAQGQIKTNKPVLIGNIASQGGAIVEDNPPCTLAQLFTLNCGPLPANNGLASFATPITISNAATSVGGVSSASLSYNEWVMKVASNGHQLAHNSPLTITTNGMSYNVSWLRQN
jgi:hypothetical protein